MIRQPLVEERTQIVPLIRIVMEDMDLPILQKIDRLTFDQMLAEAMLDPQFRYGLNHTLVYEHEGKIAGAVFGYPGELEEQIDDAFHRLYPKYNISFSDILYQDKETMSGEWYIELLAVFPEYRGLGIGKSLLNAVEALALRDGENILALNCEVENHNAHHLYQQLGYQNHSQRNLSGHLYHHMRKSLQQ